MSGCSAIGNDLSIFEGSVEPFRLDTLFCKEMHLDQLLDTEEKGSVTSAIASPISSIRQSQSEQLLSHLLVYFPKYLYINLHSGVLCASFYSLVVLPVGPCQWQWFFVF